MAQEDTTIDFHDPIRTPAECLLDAAQLRARGWTAALIHVHLPWPCAVVSPRGTLVRGEAAHAPGLRGSPRWHVHRVRLVEGSEHFAHDYARSLRRRGTTRARMRQYRHVRAWLDGAFVRYHRSLEGGAFIDCLVEMLDHQQAIEAAAGMRLPSDAADRGASDA